MQTERVVEKGFPEGQATVCQQGILPCPDPSCLATSASLPAITHRKKRSERVNAALFMAAVLHTLILSLPSHFLTADTPDAAQEPIVYLTLMPELPVPPTPRYSSQPLAQPPPPPPPEQEETANQKPPPMLSARHPVKKMKMALAKDPPASPARRDTVLRAEPAVPEAATAGADPQAAASRIVHVENRPPSAIHTPPPEYPPRARRNGWEGLAVVMALIDPAGRVHEARITEKSGHEVLDRAAVAGVRSWRFQPGRKDGQNAAMWVEVPVRFQLE